MHRADYLNEWSASHGLDPHSNRLVARWLACMFVLARPLSKAQVSPHVLTIAAVLAAAAAAGVAAADRSGASVAAAALVLLSGLLDGLDGAVAILSRRVSQFGARLDAASDRVSDLLFVAALWAVGAPASLCVIAGVLALVHEYVRARRRSAGIRDIGVITVFERPTRVIVTAAFLLSHGMYADPMWPLLGALTWAVLGTVGLVQLLAVVRRDV